MENLFMASSSRGRVDDGLTSQSLADSEAIHADSEAIHDLIGSSQFSLLTLLGLREHQTLLDIGYASIRGAKLFVPYLAPGHYYAVEPNTGLTEDSAAKEIGQGQLAVKRPTFSDDADFTLTTFGRTFDFLLADGIFSHASQRQIARFLSQARRVMKPESVFVATFSLWRPESGQEEEYHIGDAGSDAGDVCYTLERMTELAAQHGLRCQLLAWQHPAGQTSVLFTRPWWPGTIPRGVDPAVPADPAPPVPTVPAEPAPPVPSAAADPAPPAMHPEPDPPPSVDVRSPVAAQPQTAHDPDGDEPAELARTTPIVAVRPRGAVAGGRHRACGG
jgi:hypothetical protein